VFDDWVNTHMRIWLTRVSHRLILAFMDIKGQSFNFLDNWMTLNCIGNVINLEEKQKKPMSSLVQPSSC
jgi:hypothetical protein